MCRFQADGMPFSFEPIYDTKESGLLGYEIMDMVRIR